jgi:hypothetical protein
MAYDEALAERIRQRLARESDVVEKKMFGGLAFLIGGNMAVAASGQGGLLVRVDPAESDSLVATTTARPMVMRGARWRAGCASSRTTSAPRVGWPSGSSAARRTRARCQRSRNGSPTRGFLPPL